MYNNYTQIPKPVTVEWAEIIKRLAHHRSRAGLTKKQIKEIVKQRYGTTFTRLNDDQLFNFGVYLKSLPDKKQ